MLTSILLGNDPLLERIAEDKPGGPRISRTQNTLGPSVEKVQRALLLWDKQCLPVHGSDSRYGDETSAAVRRFKVEELGVPKADLFDDVGPRTVIRLDEIAAERETVSAEDQRIFTLDSWLNAPLSGISSAVSTSNVSAAHVGGDPVCLAFKSFHDLVAECKGEAALIVLSGWVMYPDNVILDGSVTLHQALEGAASRGAKVRAMLAHHPVLKAPNATGFITPLPDYHLNPHVNNAGPVDAINNLSKGNGAAIHDGQVLQHAFPGHELLGPIQVGIHHTKAWVVWTGRRLVAWCGGMDFNMDRAGRDALQDVQLEVGGQAALDVYEVLRMRWNDHPERPSAVTLPELKPPPEPGLQRARVVTTFGDPQAHAGIRGGAYAFAPSGSTTYRQLLFHMLERVEHFVYLEDQYLLDVKIAKHLAAQMSRLQAVVIVMCATDKINGELGQGWARRREVLSHLAPHAAKLAVVVRPDRWVHSKAWIFDDTVALVGSANVNRRGFEHDSEMGVAFGDIHEAGKIRELRTELWKRHLDTHAPDPGSPGEASLSVWQNPPSGARVVKYDDAGKTDPHPIPPTLARVNTVVSTWTVGVVPKLITEADAWDKIIDPHCP